MVASSLGHPLGLRVNRPRSSSEKRAKEREPKIHGQRSMTKPEACWAMTVNLLNLPERAVDQWKENPLMTG